MTDKTSHIETNRFSEEGWAPLLGLLIQREMFFLYSHIIFGILNEKARDESPRIAGLIQNQHLYAPRPLYYIFNFLEVPSRIY